MKKKVFAACLMAVTMAAVTACGVAKPAGQSDGGNEQMTEEEQDAMGEELAGQADQMAEDMLSDAQTMEDDFLDQISGEMDLEGSWMDETSGRAQMEISMNEDGSCTAMIYWGGSAFETAVWEITGTYDPASGSLTYDSARQYLHVAREDGTDSEEDETTTSGSLSKVGDRLLWKDSANDYEEHFFAKAYAGSGYDGYYVDSDDDTLTIMEEEEGFFVEILIGGVYYEGTLTDFGEGLNGDLQGENDETAQVVILPEGEGMQVRVDGGEPLYYENAMSAME